MIALRYVEAIADRIRPFVTRIVQEHGYVPDDQLKFLVYEYCGRRISSEHTIRAIHDALME